MRAVVAVGGVLTDSPLVRARVADAALRIGADGGTAHLLTLGLRPDVVIGDLDSLAKATLEALRRGGVEVAPHPALSRLSDGQVSLELAVARGATEIVVLGASGGERLDHSWALALALLGPALRAVSVTLVDGWSECVGLHEAGRHAVTFHGVTGDYVSLVAVSAQLRGVTTQGLRWSLEDADVAGFSTATVSNELAGPAGGFQIREGWALATHLFREHRLA